MLNKTNYSKMKIYEKQYYETIIKEMPRIRKALEKLSEGKSKEKCKCKVKTNGIQM